MVLEQFGMAGDDLIAEYGPQVALPPSDLEMAEYEQARERGDQVTAPVPMPFDRATQQRRAKRAERDLTELGRVNPLALEEFAALEERYNFLSTQLEDLKGARRDLPRRHLRRRRPNPAGVHRGLRGCGAGVLRGLFRRCSPAVRAAAAHRPQ